ncbi:hypothetical protein WICPIJ_008987 [Wickerhamomyces pijperi]|uniref:Uncharacterized protein n=1 Tax=Wickerhamomyces pijperi TaxID=599730 RepID=A0A9P8PSE0_WICPI|nr:hypothetical protein WICPIJ_008987 [Wickerhamomyces pijperi]
MGLNINAPTDSANVGGGGEPPTKRPKLSKQPTFEDLSKTIDQQGHSLNDIISRINSNQQNQTPSQQQSLQDFLANNNFTPTNTGLGGIPSIPNLNVSGPGSSNNNIPNNNFDLEDFLNSNDGLIEDLNNINTGTGNNGGIPSGSITEDTSTVNDKDGEDLINKVGSIEEIFDELGSDKK